MPDSVVRMESERRCNPEFDKNLRSYRQGSERSRHAGTVQMPSEERGTKVGSAKDVEGAADGTPGDTVERGQVPAYLGLVN